MAARKPAITAPIVGATRPHHLEDALAAHSLHLTHEEIASLEELYVPHPVLGSVNSKPLQAVSKSPNVMKDLPLSKV